MFLFVLLWWWVGSVFFFFLNQNFWIKRALLDLFLNDPDFMAFSHIYAEKGYAKPFKAILQCK